MAEQLDVLAIAAHPDDIEITAGGLMIKMARKGKKAGALDLTRGETGTFGTDDDRAREAAEAARIMGLTYRGNLGLPDSALMPSQENRLKIAQVIRDTRPELVILPHWDQRHPDHRVTGEMAYDACFLAGLKKTPLSGEPHRPRLIIYASYYRNFDFTYLVDISEEFDQKLEAIAAYRSQFDSSPRLPQAFEHLMPNYSGNPASEGQNQVFHMGYSVHDLVFCHCHDLGNRVGVKFAEGYTTKDLHLIDDPLLFKGKSI